MARRGALLRNIQAGGAVDDKFVNHVARGRFDSGFRNTLMAKDLGLYLRETQEKSCRGEVGGLTAEIWRQLSSESPGEDFTRVFEYLRDSRMGSSHPANS